MACIYTKRKLIGVLMVLCLLSAVCVGSASASKLTITDDGKTIKIENNSGSYTMSNGAQIQYERIGLFRGLGIGSYEINISFPDKDKDKDKSKP